MNNRFVFIMPAYNAESTIARSIASVWFQTHTNWKIIIRDDMSTDKTQEVIEGARKSFGLGEDKLSVKLNTEKKWEVANIIDMLDECQPEDIVCRLDADDWLCDCDALSIINNSYIRNNVDVLWTAHRWSFTHQNISRPLPREANPYEHP